MPPVTVTIHDKPSAGLGRWGLLLQAVRDLPDGKAACPDISEYTCVARARGSLFVSAGRVGIKLSTRFADGKLYVWEARTGMSIAEAK